MEKGAVDNKFSEDIQSGSKDAVNNDKNVSCDIKIDAGVKSEREESKVVQGIDPAKEPLGEMDSDDESYDGSDDGSYDGSDEYEPASKMLKGEDESQDEEDDFNPNGIGCFCEPPCQTYKQHGNKDNPDKNLEENRSNGPVCYNCQEKGHIARNCPQPRKRESFWGRGASSGPGGDETCFSCRGSGVCTPCRGSGHMVGFGGRGRGGWVGRGGRLPGFQVPPRMSWMSRGFRRGGRWGRWDPRGRGRTAVRPGGEGVAGEEEAKVKEVEGLKNAGAAVLHNSSSKDWMIPANNLFDN